MTPREQHAMALRLFQAGQAAEALALLREALRNDEYSELWSDWAAMQFSLGQPGEAERGFAIALELDPTNLQTAANLGALLASQGRHVEALPLLEQALQSGNPVERATAQQLLLQGQTAAGVSHPQQLEQVLRAFLSEDPNEQSYFATHIRRYVTTLQILPPGNASMRLLELGAAFHHVTPALQQCKGYGEVRCSDIWSGDAQETRQISSRAGNQTFSFVVDNFDVQRQPWPYADATFDAVLCCEMLEHLHTDPMGLFAEISRILKPDGTLLLTTPNLASAHAVEETMRGGSPYGYGKFEVGGKPTDRHNREYTASEVERLATAAGFSAKQVRTQDFYWPGKREVLRSLAVAGHPIARRGDCTILLAQKRGPVRERYPDEFYATVGVQADRRAQQSTGVRTEPAATAPVRPRHLALFHEILPHYDCSGADLRLYELLRELRVLGHRVTLIARDSRNEEKYRPPLEALGVKVYAGDPCRLRHTGYDNPSTWDLTEVLAKEKFDIAILSHWFWCGISVPEHYLDEIRSHSPATRILVLSEDRHGERERRSAQLTGFLSDIERGNNFEQREKEIYQRADLVLYVTETDQRRFFELVPGLATEHLPTIAESASPGPPFAEREGILFLGNFENLANRDALDWVLQNVWPRLRKQDARLRLYIAGHAAPTDLEKQHPGVISLGRVDDLGPLFDRHRVFAAPIRYGTGIITKNMHSISHGLPVVTTTVGAEGMQLVHNQHALIADSPEQFAAAILRLYRDESAWTAIATQGRQFVRARFCLENLRAQIQKIIAAAIALRPHPPQPGYRWSYRQVEDAVPAVLTQEPPHYRPMLRTLAYWQLGRQHLDAGNPAEALCQFRHTFTFIRGRLPSSAFHSALIDDMARAYRALGDTAMAVRCEKEKTHCIWPWPTKAPAEPSRSKAQKPAVAAPPELSVVLPTYNRANILRVCLAALAFQSLPARRWEVVVVDDGSSDQTESMCADSPLPFSLRYLRQPNQGTGAARRTGVEHARGDYLLLCNDDTIASSNLLVEHLAFHRSKPRESWAVLGEFRYSEDVGRRALSLFVNTSVFFFPQGALKPGQICDQAYFVTCNLSVSRQAVLDAGNFDPAFRVAEDTELGTRLARKNIRVIYHPAAKAWHEHATFTSADLLRRAKAYGAADWDLFQKHPHLLGTGAGPFGLLTDADRRRKQTQLNDFRVAVANGLAALEALDTMDFRLLFRDTKNGPETAKDLIGQVGKIVPMIYWHYLFETFLQKWDEQERSSHSQPTAELQSSALAR